MTVEELAEALGAEVVQDGSGPVRRLGVCIDGWDAADGEVDALLVHRWWDVAWSEGLGVLGLHDGLDDRLVPWLAEAAGVRPARPIARKTLAGPAPGGVRERVRELLGGEEDFVAGTVAAPPGSLVAVAGALDAAIVRAAAEAGVRLIVTGQWRPAAAEAIEETGVAVQLTGHARAERWALHELARRLRGEVPDLEVAVAGHA